MLLNASLQIISHAQVSRDIWGQCCAALQSERNVELSLTIRRLVGSLRQHTLFLLGALSPLLPHMTKCLPCTAKSLSAWSLCMLPHSSVPFAACLVAVSRHRHVLKPQAAVHPVVSIIPSLSTRVVTGLHCSGLVPGLGLTLWRCMQMRHNGL